MSYQNTTKKIGWLFLRASLGEFHVIVPELIHFAEENGIDLHLSFLNDKIEEQFFENDLYKVLADRYFTVVPRKKIISFALSNKGKIAYLFREYSQLKHYSVVRSLRILLKGSRLIEFPHAFSFHVSKKLSDQKTVEEPDRLPAEDCIDAFVIFTEDDKHYFRKRFPRDITTVFTPRGLSSNWLSRLKSLLPSGSIESFQKKYPKRILLTIRPPHPIYLDVKTYYELLQEVTEVVKENGYALFIKPHPRQDFKKFEEYCKKYNLHIWTKDNYSSALYFDQVITFWSSSSIDYAAMGIPSIEHYRYDQYHDQLIEQSGKLSSLYVNMGLSLPSTSKEELSKQFRKITEHQTEIAKKQQDNLKKTYQAPPLELSSIKFRKNPQYFSVKEKIKHAARLLYYCTKN